MRATQATRADGQRWLAAAGKGPLAAWLSRSRRAQRHFVCLQCQWDERAHAEPITLFAIDCSRELDLLARFARSQASCKRVSGAPIRLHDVCFIAKANRLSKIT